MNIHLKLCSIIFFLFRVDTENKGIFFYKVVKLWSSEQW